MQRWVAWWTQTSSWHDLYPDGRLLASSSFMRQQLLDHLKHCVPGHWYCVDALLYAIWRQAPLYLYDAYHQTFTKPTSLRSRWHEWMQREGMAYVGLLTSPQEGARGAEQESPTLVCVTAFGGEVLTQAPPHTPQRNEAAAGDPKPLLIVQPNYDLLVM